MMTAIAHTSLFHQIGASPHKQEVTYQAPPSLDETPIRKTAKIFFAVVIFPLGALWLIQKAVRYIVSIFITHHYKTDLGMLEYSYGALAALFPHCTKNFIRSSDGTLINFIHFPSTNPQSKKVIIVAPGLGNEASNMALDWQGQWNQDFHDAHVVFVDPRGVGYSEGFLDIEKGAEDVYAIAQYFIEQHGIAPTSCLFWGFSLGGGTAARAAKLLQKTYPEEKISLVHQNSFRKFTIATQNLLAGCFGLFSRIGLSLINQELTPESDTKHLQGKTVVIYNTQDDIILRDAKFHPTGTSYQVFPIQGKRNAVCNPHMRPLTKKEKPPIHRAIRELLA